MKVLIDSEGRRYYCESKELHTKYGKIKVKNGKIKSHLGNNFLCFEATFADKINKINRGPAIIIKKDIGSIIAYTGINSDSKILDAGTGCGVLAAFLANISRHVTSYEISKEFLEIAKRNFKFLDVKVNLKNKDIYKGISEKNLDLITLDLLEPWRVLKHAKKALKSGGYVVVYSPQITQIIQLIKEAKDFVVERVIENIEREWVIDAKRARPKTQMLGHTGFLVFLRKY